MHTNERRLVVYTCEWKMRWGDDSIVMIRKYPKVFSSIYEEKMKSYYIDTVPSHG